MNQHMSRLLLRWSAAMVTLLTFVGVYLVLSDIYIPVKQPMQVCLEHDGNIYGYATETTSMQNGDTLTVHCDNGAVMAFTVAGRENAHGMSVLELLPQDSVDARGVLESAPRLNAYVYQGRTRLADLMLAKWMRRR